MKTPLFHEHEKLRAKIVDFHGWDMPVWYTGIKDEHMATRKSCGLFDVCHMGEIYVSGNASLPYLERILTRDIASMKQGRVLYTFLLNETGGIIDDLTVYCIKPGERYMLCVNASNSDNDFSWITAQNKEHAVLENKSDRVALLALQGPGSAKILRQRLDFDLESIKFYHFTIKDTAAFGELMISKTGYTGAGGVEIFMSPDKVILLWQSFLEAGATPCGLGSRDTLRLEMGYPLHGNDINEKTTPFEANLGFAIDMSKPFFIGKDALLKQKNNGIKRSLTGLVLVDKGVPRQDCLCFSQEKEVGIITSGSISPVLNKGIALAYLDSAIQEGTGVDIMVREKRLKAEVKKPPFVKGSIT